MWSGNRFGRNSCRVNECIAECLKGDKGDKGDQGNNGAQGPPGPALDSMFISLPSPSSTLASTTPVPITSANIITQFTPAGSTPITINNTTNSLVFPVAGYYQIQWTAPIGPGTSNLNLRLNGTDIASTNYELTVAAGNTDSLGGLAILQTTTVNSSIQLVAPSGDSVILSASGNIGIIVRRVA